MTVTIFIKHNIRLRSIRTLSEIFAIAICLYVKDIGKSIKKLENGTRPARTEAWVICYYIGTPYWYKLTNTHAYVSWGVNPLSIYNCWYSPSYLTNLWRFHHLTILCFSLFMVSHIVSFVFMHRKDLNWCSAKAWAGRNILLTAYM